jgi:hypothetical protein
MQQEHQQLQQMQTAGLKVLAGGSRHWQQGSGFNLGQFTLKAACTQHGPGRSAQRILRQQLVGWCLRLLRLQLRQARN